MGSISIVIQIFKTDILLQFLYRSPIWITVVNNIIQLSVKKIKSSFKYSKFYYSPGNEMKYSRKKHLAKIKLWLEVYIFRNKEELLNSTSND